LPFYKTSYLNEEVNCTEPSPSVSFPWQVRLEVGDGLTPVHPHFDYSLRRNDI